MPYMNRVFLAGNLTRDPEVRRLPSNTAVAKLGLAVSRKFQTRAGEEKEEVCFVDVEAWDRLAENCEKYLKKGAPILLEGSLRYREWNDSETGKKRRMIEVRADRIEFLWRPDPQPSASSSATSFQTPNSGLDDALPTFSPRPSPAPDSEQDKNQDDSSTPDSDVPF